MATLAGGADQRAAQRTGALIKPNNKRRSSRDWRFAWLWAGPAVFFAVVYLVYPVLDTIWLSLENETSSQFVGLKNYHTIFTNPNLLGVLRNNLLWLVLGTIVTVFAGLVIAVLVDRVPDRERRQGGDLHPDGDLVCRRGCHLGPGLPIRRIRAAADWDR